MTEQDFMTNILGNAQRLCNPNMDKKISRISEEKNFSNSQNIDTTAYDSDADKWDAMFLSESAISAPKQQPQHLSGAQSKMPKAIKESILSNPIDTKALSDNPLDRMDLSALMRETVQPTQIQQQVASPSIDYSIIKAIINECLDNKLKDLKSETLNEGTLKTIGLKEGKIRLVDNKGNIFSAKLQKEGNINDK